ncbi:Pimeloyl-ACP methyl ester carboxylesterase [Methanophagales archaeon]|nr:Pimeloyl-ACP methyl ester carboxylesterase [Methanophagales archaeon]
MGTQIALELALDHPESVDKLILYSANCGGAEGVFPGPEVANKFRNISGTPEERASRAFEILLPEQWLAEQIPGAWLVQFKGGGHGLMFQYPEKFSSIVLYFLECSSTAGS